MKWTIPLFIFFALLSAETFAAQEFRFASGVRQTVMIELYTSEGCNSCPPAEEYLNGYVSHPGLWKTYIPLAFHVDYWDYLGWKDRFAHPSHAVRQRHYARLQRVRTVYTPAFVVNGQGWRSGWFSKAPSPETRPAGRLTVTVKGQRVSADFEPVSALSGKYQLNLAVLGMDLSTRIQAGENQGRHSRHEFVVLAKKQVAGKNNHWKMTLPEIDTTITRRFALAAWISKRDNPTPIQAVGGYIPGALLRAKGGGA